MQTTRCLYIAAFLALALVSGALGDNNTTDTGPGSGADRFQQSGQQTIETLPVPQVPAPVIAPHVYDFTPTFGQRLRDRVSRLRYNTGTFLGNLFVRNGMKNTAEMAYARAQEDNARRFLENQQRYDKFQQGQLVPNQGQKN